MDQLVIMIITMSFNDIASEIALKDKMKLRMNSEQLGNSWESGRKRNNSVIDDE